MKERWRVEVLHDGAWTYVLSDRVRSYCEGYVEGQRHEAPRPAYRIVDGRCDKIVRVEPARSDAGVGMIASYPTPNQLVRAALGALARIRPPSHRLDDPRRSTPQEWAAIEAAVAALRPLVPPDGAPE